MASRAVFLRGVNLGPHRRFKNAQIVDALSPLDVTPIAAAGTFLVTGAMPDAKLRAAIDRALGFSAEAAIYPAREITDLVARAPFKKFRAPWMPFVTVLTGAPALRPKLPLEPAPKLRIVSVEQDHYVLVVRQPGAAYPDLDKMFGARGTTRGWPTILKLAAAIEAG